MKHEPVLDIQPEELRIVKTILQQHIPHLSVWAFDSRVKDTAKSFRILILL